jgi:hypothetical protein
MEPQEKSFVIVRSRDAGVHCGTLENIADGGMVTLFDARRIWRWRGANTLSELSQRGADQEWTRISVPVPEIVIIGACEIIPCSVVARENLTRSRWSK